MDNPLKGTRRSILRGTAGSAFAGIAGTVLPGQVAARELENTCVQVDLVEITDKGIKETISDSNKYNDEHRLISWLWGDWDTEISGEDLDNFPYESQETGHSVAESDDISLNFDAGEASVTVDVTGGDGGDIDLALASYEAPCGPGPVPGWDGSEQSLFDSQEVLGTSSGSVSLTVNIPSGSDSVPDIDGASISGIASPPTAGQGANHGVEFDVIDADAENIDSITYEVDGLDAEGGDFAEATLNGDVDIGQDSVSASVNGEGDELVVELASSTTIDQDDTVSFTLQGVTNPNTNSYDVTVAIYDGQNQIASRTATDELVISPPPESITLEGDTDITANNAEATGSYTVTVDYGDADAADITVGLSMWMREFFEDDITEIRAGPSGELVKVGDGSEIRSLVPSPIGALDVTALATEGGPGEAQVEVEIDFAVGTFVEKQGNFAAATGSINDVIAVGVDTTGAEPVVQRILANSDIIVSVVFNESITVDGNEDGLEDAFEIDGGQFTNDVAPIQDATIPVEGGESVDLELNGEIVSEDGPEVEDALTFTNGDGAADNVVDNEGNLAEDFENKPVFVGGGGDR
jgi:hypothetical protein